MEWLDQKTGTSLAAQANLCPTPRQRHCSDWPGQFRLDGNHFELEFSPDQIFLDLVEKQDSPASPFANGKHVLETGGPPLSPLCLRDKKDIKEGNRKRREGGRELWLYSEGIRNSDLVLRDERESADKKDNRGESKVRAPVRLRGGRKKLLFLLPHSIRNWTSQPPEQGA